MNLELTFFRVYNKLYFPTFFSVCSPLFLAPTPSLWVLFSSYWITFFSDSCMGLWVIYFFIFVCLKLSLSLFCTYSWMVGYYPSIFKRYFFSIILWYLLSSDIYCVLSVLQSVFGRLPVFSLIYHGLAESHHALFIFTYPTLYSLNTFKLMSFLSFSCCQHSHFKYCFSVILSISFFWNSSILPWPMWASLYLCSLFLNYFSCFKSVFDAFWVNSLILLSNSLILSSVMSNLEFVRPIKISHVAEYSMYTLFPGFLSFFSCPLFYFHLCLFLFTNLEFSW